MICRPQARLTTSGVGIPIIKKNCLRSGCYRIDPFQHVHRSKPKVARASNLKVTTQSPSSAEHTQQQDVHQTFSWTKQWYCIGITEDFDALRPTSIALLNKQLVVWFSSADGQWHCFEDRCPHRAASLSEGKVWEDGTLYCSYHGWRFNSSGSCTVIPQAASDKAEADACSKPRACASVYPIKNAQGKLFVWAEAGVEAAVESEQVPVPIDLLQAQAEAQQKQQHHGEASPSPPLLQAMPPYSRILPYDYRCLVENLIDPSHVPFSHHGLAGNRDHVKHGNEETRRVDTPAGSVFKMVRRPATSRIFDREAPLYLEFQPPNLVLYYQQRPDGTFFSFPSWCTPISPGKSLLVTHQTTNYSTIPRFLKIISKFPRWLDHLLLRLKVVDGDTPLLVDQERTQIEEDKKVAKKKKNDNNNSENGSAPPSWRRLFYMPTSSDVGVVAFRTWLDGKAARGGPFGPLHEIDDFPDPPANRQELLERFHSHTERCSSCKTVYSRVEWLLSAAETLSKVLWGSVVALAFLSLDAIFFVGGGGGSTGAATGLKGLAAKLPVSLPTAIIAIVCAFLATMAVRFLKNLRDQFVFVDYRHADIE